MWKRQINKFNWLSDLHNLEINKVIARPMELPVQNRLDRLVAKKFTFVNHKQCHY